MKNVLIVSRRFPPANHIAARRFGYMVGYMEEFGWRPWIVTQPASGDLQVPIPEAQIARVAARRSQSQSPKTGIRAWRALRYRAGVLSSSWYWSVVSDRKTIDSFPKPDIVLASYGPNSALWLGRYFSKRYRVPWIADFRDPGALRDASDSSIARKLDRCAERAVLRSAAAITTAGTAWSDEMAKVYDRPVQTIYNGYAYTGDEIAAAQSQSATANSADYIYYAGTVYSHQLPALRIVLDALAVVPDLRLRMRLLGVEEAVRAITSWVTASPVADRIELLDSCSAAVALQEANTAYCNLVLGDLGDEPSWTRGHMTGKFLELVALKPPVMAVAGSVAAFYQVLSTTQKGTVCHTSDEVADFLRDATIRERFAGEALAVERYSKRNQCLDLCSFLDRFVVGTSKMRRPQFA